MTDRLHADLAQAARRSGLSQSEQVEHLLAVTLQDWGTDVFQIAGLAARMLCNIERHARRRWLEDKDTSDLFAGAIAALVRNYRDRMLAQNRRRSAIDEMLEGKTVNQAEYFAATVMPPLPASDDPDQAERDQATRESNLAAWRADLAKANSRPIT